MISSSIITETFALLLEAYRLLKCIFELEILDMIFDEKLI